VASPPVLDARPGRCRRQAQPQQPIFRVNLVRVDVIVTDGKGTPITGLTQDDFEVFEDGQRQAIDSFKLWSQPGAAAGRRAGPADSQEAIRRAGPASGRAPLRDLFDDYQAAQGLHVPSVPAHPLHRQLSPLDAAECTLTP
jgi:hypothetical protein